MKTPANSESGWWIITLLNGFYKKTDSGYEGDPSVIRKSTIVVRCIHWREAYNKCMNHMRDKTFSPDVDGRDFGTGRWEFIGIYSLSPLPESLTDFQLIANIEHDTLTQQCDYFRDCPQSYSIEDSFDEHRETVNWSRPIIDSRNEF